MREYEKCKRVVAMKHDLKSEDNGLYFKMDIH